MLLVQRLEAVRRWGGSKAGLSVAAVDGESVVLEEEVARFVVDLAAYKQGGDGVLVQGFTTAPGTTEEVTA